LLVLQTYVAISRDALPVKAAPSSSSDASLF
jgi:hypothetical protein